jgi:acetylornithine deacetylase/succinyl-diaminopimelate desuccinylase-like protein
MKKLTMKAFILGACLFTSQIALGRAQPLSTADLLKELIRINTTNPPGNETAAVHWVKTYLQDFGIPAKIIESAPGRGNLIARIKGSGKKPPLLLLAHLDVVTAEPGEWKFPPFEPTVSNAYLYGRGALDMKGQAALMINTLVRLHLKKVPLAGDVLLVLVADEEAGGQFGAGFLTDHYWEEIKPGLVINEGSIAIQMYGLHLYPIQVAEKGVAWLEVLAQGTSGHGSMPIPNNASLSLIRALNRISKKPQPLQKTAMVEEMLKRLAPHFSFPQSFLLKHLFDFPIRQLIPWLAGSKIQSDKILNALVRNTVVPTVLQAGTKTNVIPSQARAEVDCRILPGETPEKFKNKITKMIDDPRIRVRLTTQSLPNESNFNTPYFKALEESILEVDPEAVVLPFLSPGATDNRFFREKGALAYGIIPLLITLEDLEGLHGKNERIPLKEIPKGEKILFNFVKKVQSTDS